MKTVRAKFTCTQSSKTDWGGEHVFLHPVYDANNSPEDNTYSSATPAGRVELIITNPEAHGFFIPNNSYYIDFTPVS